ncbi:MAG TPA: hypothetical protein VFM16_01265 [Holophagaceae bacterium]|nr:hypothetical protein [Holophagaceae bacterium]
MTIRRLFLPAALAGALLASAPALRAQAPGAEHASPGDHGQDREGLPAPKPHALREVQPGEKAEAPAGKAEAEGHEPEVKLFGASLDSFWQWIIQLVNLGLFAGALIYLLKGPVKAAFASHRKELEDRLAQAERDKAEGEAQIQELEAKMAGLQAELGEILAKAGEEAEAEKQRVLEAAKSEAAAILAAAESEISRQQQLASQQLRALVAELAVEAAAKRLEARVQGAAAQTVTDHAIAELGAGNGGLQ